MQCFLFSLLEKKSSYVTRQQKIVECISSSNRVTGTRIEFPELESSSRNSRRHVQHIFGPRIVEWPGYANMQIFMLSRQLDGFDPLKITKVRANSNSNSKLELDEVWNSFDVIRPHAEHRCGLFLYACLACVCVCWSHPRAVQKMDKPIGMSFGDILRVRWSSDSPIKRVNFDGDMCRPIESIALRCACNVPVAACTRHVMSAVQRSDEADEYIPCREGWRCSLFPNYFGHAHQLPQKSRLRGSCGERGAPA